jgi:hypothetical protein
VVLEGERTDQMRDNRALKPTNSIRRGTVNGVLRTAMRNAVLFTLVYSSVFAGEGRPLFWGHLRAGRFQVGFRTIQEKSGELHVWYPAVADSRAAMTMAEYLRLSRDLVGSVEKFESNDAALGKTLTIAITGQADTRDYLSDKLEPHLLADSRHGSGSVSG